MEEEVGVEREQGWWCAFPRVFPVLRRGVGDVKKGPSEGKGKDPSVLEHRKREKKSQNCFWTNPDFRILVSSPNLDRDRRVPGVGPRDDRTLRRPWTQNRPPDSTFSVPVPMGLYEFPKCETLVKRWTGFGRKKTQSCRGVGVGTTPWSLT